LKLDPQKTALLTLDLQKGVFGLVPGSERVMTMAVKAVAFARHSPSFMWVLRFPRDTRRFQILNHPPFFGSNKTIFSSRALPPWNFTDIFHPDDLVIYKQRVGAFSDNHLELVLRSRRVEHLVFFGIATSGIVLSTLRRAFDLDFRSVVLKDASFDADQEVHRVLTEKVFPVQAWVAATDEFIAAQKR